MGLNHRLILTEVDMNDVGVVYKQDRRQMARQIRDGADEVPAVSLLLVGMKNAMLITAQLAGAAPFP